MFGSRKGVSPRRVEHNDAAARRRLNIDIIHAHSRAANHAKFCAGIQNRRRDFSLAAHDYRTERRNERDEFALAQPSLDRDLQRAIPRELIHSAFRDWIGDQDLWRIHVL